MRIIARTAGALMAGLFVGTVPAVATVIDLSAWTCATYQAADKSDVGVILSWLDGYYRDEDDPAEIDTAKLAANAKKLGEYCAAHPDVDFLTATDRLFSK